MRKTHADALGGTAYDEPRGECLIPPVSPESRSVPVIRCPSCTARRIDDGTPCAQCGVYARTDIQIQRERHLRAQELPMYNKTV